ncbi:hypothetical protein [Saccharopolyspora sp. 7B]|uniref:hypothetical protein n=1 Tax=Saccharopolyspora sp. 7B TaxID=2877240 RepID=UPI001CD1F3D9|nr:hypothetical protein [Saccharopolyspora sp. 7B]MCA1279663.1 hypothetical protein [Saccharopolyspora sp. 7B]
MSGSDELVTAEDAVAALTAELREGQVFGPAVQQDGTTLLPVVQVRRGGGVSGRRKNRSGGGGTIAKPVGAWAVTAQGAVWHPAVDVNRIVLGGQVALNAVAVALAVAFRRKR